MTIKVVGSLSGLESTRSGAEAENHEEKSQEDGRQDKAVEGEYETGEGSS